MKAENFNRALIEQREYLRRCMEVAGVSMPTHLARKAGINPSLINKIMNSARPSSALLGRKSLSALYNVTGLVPPDYKGTPATFGNVAHTRLASTDAAMARVFEDLLTILVHKGIVSENDLPPNALDLIRHRRQLRGQRPDLFRKRG